MVLVPVGSGRNPKIGRALRLDAGKIVPSDADDAKWDSLDIEDWPSEDGFRAKRRVQKL